jgi:hypothetical protein
MAIQTEQVKSKASIEALFDFDKFLGAPPEEKKEGEKVTEKIFEKQEKAEEKAVEKEKTAEEIAKETTDAFSALSPTMVIEMFDIAMSRTFAMPMKLLGYECKFEEFKLTASEKKFLSPFISAAVVEYLKTLKPRDVLIIALVFMYGGKTLDVVTSRDRKTKKKKPVVQKSNDSVEDVESRVFENESQTHNEEIRYNKDGSIAKKRGPKTM